MTPSENDRTAEYDDWRDQETSRAYGYSADPDDGLDDPERYQAVEDDDA